ncbi:MAG TPA: alpha/beta hydrolase [Mesotoga infera]|uniref:Alpha/beta hydrolase n=1 Tax=Mesotoga infera TaxID=1236046 RepID=A0A7C1GPX1_9BACT|nr:alpha/beta hydrolase [Mesotoga infera]
MNRGNAYLWLIVLGAVVTGLAIGAADFLVPYPPMVEALQALNSSNMVLYSFKDRIHTFSTRKESKVGVIFYPGGLVDPIAYAPLLKELATKNLTTFLVDMPLDLAILSPNSAAAIIESNPDIGIWIMAGHSLGGSMPARFASRNQGIVSVLILLAAYPASVDSLSESDLHVLSVYGSEDTVIDKDALEKGRSLLPADTTYIVIEGGNHAQFGYYGPQKGDGKAVISLLEQQKLTVDAILAMIEEIT